MFVRQKRPPLDSRPLTVVDTNPSDKRHASSSPHIRSTLPRWPVLFPFMRIAQAVWACSPTQGFSQSKLGRPNSIAACALALQVLVDYRGRLAGKPVTNRGSYLRCVCSRGGTRSTLREIWRAAERAHEEAFKKVGPRA